MNPNGELPEKDFIQERYPTDPGVLWIIIAILFGTIAILWGAGSWYSAFISEAKEEKPFLQVTNRQLSVFLWYHPDRMRANVSSKSGYLPAFQYEQTVTVDPLQADQFAIAPPELLFRYLLWARLLLQETTTRAIPADQFLEFLSADQQWMPRFWTKAPQAYQVLVETLRSGSTQNLASLSNEALPQEVRLAFQGWKNFALEAEKIKEMPITGATVENFLQNHPHYARNYWRNIDLHYLQEMLKPAFNREANVPSEQIPSFLRQAIYNATAD